MTEAQAGEMLTVLEAVRDTLHVLGYLLFFIMLAQGAQLGREFFR